MYFERRAVYAFDGERPGAISDVSIMHFLTSMSEIGDAISRHVNQS